MSRWNLVTYNGVRMRQVGIMPDGTQYNRNGDPEDDVRTAVNDPMPVVISQSQASMDSAMTRRHRTSRRVYVIGKRITLITSSIRAERAALVLTRANIANKKITGPAAGARRGRSVNAKNCNPGRRRCFTVRRVSNPIMFQRAMRS